MLRRKQLLDGLDDEMRDHLERATQENIDRGLSPEEARRQAALKFGNFALAREDVRSVWIRGWVDQLIQDGRYAFRSFRRNRTFAGVVVLTLAVAIGMNTAIFSVFNAVVLRPLGYPHADRLVWLSTIQREGDSGIVIGPDFVDWRAQATSFERMAAYGIVDHTVVTPRGAARARAAMVTEDFWDLSGARPVAGRLPRSGERGIVIISSSFAQRWFDGDAGAIGRTVMLDGRQVVVAGILPEQFRFELPRSNMLGIRARDIDVYQPIQVSPRRWGPMQLLHVVGRLKERITIAAARAELAAIRDRAASALPKGFADQGLVVVVPLHDQLVGGAGLALRVLLGAVGFVLLIACVNVASLHLARASGRRREIAVRMSIGASPARVLRQLLVESLVLAGLGSAAGLVVARLAIAAILWIDPYAIPRLTEVTIDGRVLAAVLVLAVLTALAFGLAPVFAFWKTDPHDALKSGNRAVSAGASALRARRLLVAGEIALALLLLIGAGLMMKSAWRLYGYAPGFEPERVLTARVVFSGPEYRKPQASHLFAEALLDKLRREPRVEAVSLSTYGDILAQGLIVEGEPRPTREALGRNPPLMVNATSASLKTVLGLRMVRGRWFADGEPAAVLNETLARREMPGRDPIGARIQVVDGGSWLTIVGIAADLKHSQLDAPAEPEVYVPYERMPGGLFAAITTLVLTTGEPLTLAPRLRQLMAEVDRTQVPDEINTLERTLTGSIAPRRLNLFLLSTFAAAAVFVAMIGVYGVMAYSVAQRVHEIGIRMALGARRMDVVGMVARQGLSITVAGTVAGLAGAFALTRFMDSLLYEVPSSDPLTFAVLAVGLGLTSLVACSIPALKAALVDPTIALRSE